MRELFLKPRYSFLYLIIYGAWVLILDVLFRHFHKGL